MHIRLASAIFIVVLTSAVALRCYDNTSGKMRTVVNCKTCKIVTITPKAFVYRCSHTPCRENDPDEFCCITSLCNDPKGSEFYSESTH
ncbi:hypothetical protein CSKR_203450 [Clonorchis sinensis]|uniref:Uncharacterized protein n=1 Tax=Clonorchis sinensis TaxID=79923 RepID=A0A8T1MBF5_CLOSI|nr:hypothetical protein CSKR_203450 [Clonorchis sinensis]